MAVTFTFDALEGLLAKEQIVRALDDNGDGEADASVWDAVLSAANGRLEAAANGAEIPEAQALWAAKLFAAKILFDRCGFSDKRNPHETASKDAESRIREISDAVVLDEQEVESGAITEDLKMSGREERLV